MTEKPTCSCGQNEPKRLLFPCAGQSNTGQITNLAAIQLTEEGYGKIVCTSLLATGSEGLVKSARDAEEVVALDGCPMSCAAKIAEGQGVEVGQKIIVTELGIAKGPSKSYTTDDIEKVVAACWAGNGRKNEPVKKGSDNKKSTCGCGGSCK